MLHLLALGAFAYQTPIGSPDIGRLIRAAGYRFVSDGAGRVTGVVTKGRESMRLDPGVVTNPQIAFRLSIEIDVARGLTRAEASSWLAHHSASERLLIEPLIGHRAWLESLLAGHDASSVNSIRQRLDWTFGMVRSFAKSFHGRFLPAQGLARPFDDDVIDTADLGTFMRIVDAWRWRVDKFQAGSGNGWAIPIAVAKRRLVLRGVFSRNQEISVQADFHLPQGADLNRWLETCRRRLPEARWVRGDEVGASVTLPIDLTKGVRLGDLRSRIESFGRRIDQISRSAPRPNEP